MVIKKLLSFVTIIAISLGISACSSSNETSSGASRTNLFFRDDKKIAEERFQTIIESIEKKRQGTN